MANKARQYLKYSIVCLFALAVQFFLCIFLLGLANKHDLNNQIKVNVPIQQNEVQTWGEIPGKLGYTWSRNYTLYEFAYKPTRGASLVNLNTVGEFAYDVTRDLADATWYPQKSVVNYVETYDYTPIEEDSATADDTTMLTINMGGYNVWYQMSNKPKYYQAWQALTQAYDLITISDFVNRQYAYNGLNYFFNDYASVQTYVLPTLTELQQSTVYNDATYGMNTITGLSKWMAACRPQYPYPPSSTTEYQEITAHFADLGIVLTDEQMSFAVGNGSMMVAVAAAIETAILRTPSLGLHDIHLTVDMVLQGQWGFSGSTSSVGNTLHGVEEIYSVAALNDIFPFAPEFGAYVLDPTRGDSDLENALSYDSSVLDFSQSLSSYSTFLRTDVMKQFYQGYEAKDQSLMSNLFGFQSWESAEMFHTYLDEMIEYFLTQEQSYNVIALSSVMNKNWDDTILDLDETLPITVTSRVMASIMAADGNDCQFYFETAEVTTEDATTICAGYDLSNPNDVTNLLNGTWYGGTYKSAMLTATGITTEQQTSFYDSSVTDSFGSVYAQALTEISAQYGCADAANCTSSELSGLQYGSLGVTQNPSDTWSSTYMPEADTVAGWGNSAWYPYGLWTEPVEYPPYTAAQKKDWTTIETATVQNMMKASYEDLGLSNLWLWQSFLIPYYGQNTAEIEKYQTAWGSDIDIDAFVQVCRERIEEQYFGGAFADIAVSDMLNGYETEYASLIEGQDYFKGGYFGISSLTQPICNSLQGPQSEVSYGMYTGSNGEDEIGQLRIMNEQAYVNKEVQVYNGADLVWMTQKDPAEDVDQEELDDVSYGMQFPPFIEEDDQLRLYDARNLKVMTYSHQESKTLTNGDKADLQVEKFEATASADDIGFGYNLPLYEKPRNCYGCTQYEQDLRTITIDGAQYNISATPSDNYITVQPDTGYTYQIKKDSTVYMIVGSANQTFVPDKLKATPFPSLDPIYGAAWPLYDFSENLVADKSDFTSKFDYVAESQQSLVAIVISQSVCAAFFLILAIVAITVYKLKDPKRNVDSSEEQLVHNEDLME